MKKAVMKEISQNYLAFKLMLYSDVIQVIFVWNENGKAYEG
jgi:hypothetical protein